MIQAIIVDDEIDGREALRLAIQRHCPALQVVAVCSSAPEAKRAILKLKPKLVFLDIQMPHMSGFDLLEQMEQIDFATIFVTAFDSFAIKAIKFSAFDYLLKPLDTDDLQTAVERFVSEQEAQPVLPQYDHLLHNLKAGPVTFERLAIPTPEGLEFVPLDKIIYCQANGNYSIIHMRDRQQYLVSRSLKECESLLEEQGFCRVHHASLINLTHVQKYIKGEGGYVILSEGHHVDISRRRKEEFLKRIAIL